MEIDGVNDKITDSFAPAFPNIAMEDTVSVIKDLSADCFPELDGRHPSDNVNELVLKRKLDVLELHGDGVKIITNSSQTTKKRTRVAKDAAEVWKNVQSNKNRKNNLNGNEESNIGSDGQSSSTSTSDDDNVSQDNTNGGLLTTSDSKAAQKRRERVNERLRVLQNLVPNGTQVDISTMLEEAVHYVKFMQLQIKLLSSDELWMYAPMASISVSTRKSALFYDPRRSHPTELF
ncbi:transcription factor RSL2-like [Hibiscus syriacus]|uniref:transcription factor RSL2-like n=1 Tax=Hibiscus syriacus TaxID=106335 RepID=UPI001923056B|nr:transcription factor RSL2-like [Hibiscus syriacus]